MPTLAVAAATVLDTRAHMERFVDGNLRSGLDHLVVFLDRPNAEGQAEVAEYLDAHAAVTCVRAGRDWWGESRPRGLNERQCTNANVVRRLVAEIPGVDWVFHIDGDEVVRLDREALEQVPAATPAVQLATREAVAREEWGSEPTEFKRELDDGDLALLHALGVIDEPSNRAYFHGHLQGKAGVRPNLDARFTLHRAVDADGVAVPAHVDDRLELFHYESYSGEEFVRKWTAMVAAGPPASYRPGRASTARGLHALVAKGLPDDRLRAYLLEIFRRTTADDAVTLSELGLLVLADPLAGTHAPAALDSGSRDLLAAGLDRLRGTPKNEFFNGVRPRSDSASPRPGRPRRWRRG